MFVWTPNASLRAWKSSMCVWVGVHVGVMGIIRLDLTPLCLSVRGCDYVLHYVGLNRLSPLRACVRGCRRQSPAVCCRTTDVLVRIER